MMAGPSAMRELAGRPPQALLQCLATEQTPVVIRAAASHWPLVQASLVSSASAMAYLLGFYRGAPVHAFVAEAQHDGRIFYTDGLANTNFQQVKTTLPGLLDRIRDGEARADSPTIYMGSAALEHVLPGIAEANSWPLEGGESTVRVWLGNQTTVAAHYDALDNLAVVCAGRRRFTLFPPAQLANLYVGPIDFTPAGQAISLVNFDQPDFALHPRFAEALSHAVTAVLEPGDAIFIPCMWWHHVQALAPFNVLINHWWREAAPHMGPPGDALLHAILNIRDLPPAHRRAWQGIFNHYVFEPGAQVADHIPVARRGPLGPIDEDCARKMRALLRANLNR